MKKLIKQVLGIDVAQKELVVCLAKKYDDWTEENYFHKTFVNAQKALSRCCNGLTNITDINIPVNYVMEATGVYHESLAYYLRGQDQIVSIVLPNKISHYARTLNVKTVTDKTASEAIAQFGLERKTDQWEKPLSIFKKMKTVDPGTRPDHR